MTALRIEAVRKSYGAGPVLEGVDLAVADGATLALLGPSGCGKTTLLRLIAGFERVDAGRIVAGSRTLDDGRQLMPTERRAIGYVPQDGLLFPHLSVGRNVAFGLTGAQRRAGWATEALALSGLAGFEARRPEHLSGGQQQRAALARALAPRPGVMLLDEPFNALDLGLRRGLAADVLAVLRRQGTTTVMVTHDPAEAFAGADQVAVMRAGRIVQCDAPSAVYLRPADRDVARLTGPVVELPGTVADGMATTPLGPIPVGNATYLPGTAVVLLRPEQLTITTTGTVARLVDRAFRGDHVAATAVVGGMTLPVRLDAFATYGDTVHLSVRGPCQAFPAA